jgi:tellurite resistance protein TerB
MGAILDFIQKAKDAVNSATFKFQHRHAPDAAMAACALVAAATGGISAEESKMTIDLAANLPALKAFDKVKLAKLFMGFADTINNNAVVGKVLLLGEIEQVKGTDDAAMVVRCGIAVGGADGDFDPTEKEVVREIIKALGLAASDFGL